MIERIKGDAGTSLKKYRLVSLLCDKHHHLYSFTLICAGPSKRCVRRMCDSGSLLGISMQNRQMFLTRTENAKCSTFIGARGAHIMHSAHDKHTFDSHPNGNHTNSSPRSTVTPFGPDRLTLPPDRQQPSFSTRHPLSDSAQANIFAQEDNHEYNASGNRPGSSRFVQYVFYLRSSSSPARKKRSSTFIDNTHTHHRRPLSR